MPDPVVPTQAQLDAGFRTARQLADDSGYGSFVSDDKIRDAIAAIAPAILNA